MIYQKFAIICQYKYTPKQSRLKCFGVFIDLFTEQIISPAVYRIFFVAPFTDPVADELADAEDQCIAGGFKTDLAQIQCIGTAVHGHPEPLEQQQNNEQQAEMQQKIE